MKELITLSFATLSFSASWAQGNALDKNFGDQGKVATHTQLYRDEDAYSVVCQSDGKIIAAGVSGFSSNTSAAMIRYKANGNVDSAFGNLGRVLLYPGTGSTQALGVAVQKLSGIEYIILGGRHYDPVNNVFSILLGRYLPSGNIDASFGAGGTVEIPGAAAQKLITDTAGRLLLAGIDDAMNAPAAFGLHRLLPNGQPDMLFGTNGYASRPDTVLGDPTALAQQKDGKILVGGFAFSLPLTGKYDFGIVRYLPDGTVDSTFGVDGLVLVDPDTNAAEIHALAIQPDGKILVGGTSDTGTGNHFFLARLLQNGTIDNSFGTGGHTRTNFGNSQSWASEVLLQDDGKIYLVGHAAPAGGNQSYNFAIARYTSSGILDSTFGVHGRDTSNIGSYSGARAAAITPNRSIIAAGWSYWSLPLGRFNDFTLMKYLTGLELGVINLATKPQPVVYPNPVRASINVSYELQQEDVLTVQLLDMAGRTVQVFSKNEGQHAGKHTALLQLTNSITAGQYLLQITGKAGACNIKLQVVQ